MKKLKKRTHRTEQSLASYSCTCTCTERCATNCTCACSGGVAFSTNAGQGTVVVSFNNSYTNQSTRQRDFSTTGQFCPQ